MKRRRFVQSLIGAPAASALLAQQATPPPGNPGNPAPPGGPQNAARGIQPPGAASQDMPHFDASVPDVGADPMPHYFTPAQFEALRHLCGILLPPVQGHAGAVEARAPEFLDFLIGQSPEDRQQIYREGLDALNAEAKKRFRKDFAATSPEESAAILAPLEQPWQYNPPDDPLGRFLVAAKADVRTATVNSREYLKSGGSGGGRRFGGAGLYWYSLD